ncbi:argonaute binding protein 1 [Schizosaccharomyces octosporus yFS286]|uniref:Argonaute binding protein 1 n=1 Tax=Schizosaccharomyces octosporus (strain yFS286) TaxID=483514 RepID=S9R2N0_SCHOY|nr:argonaute binding protein 1 [Schizosaccharomyces octosporus yFS286]EPX72615.1 argonaute binding protein 1 [Schizosaccharomyces octosporus yFS286]
MNELVRQEEHTKHPNPIPEANNAIESSRKTENLKKQEDKLTGWEDDFQEPEISKEEKAEIEKLYSLEVPLIVRMERFVQKYRKNRRWNEANRSRLFSMYLALGGISSGQKQFTGGLDVNEGDDAQSTENQTAIDFIQHDILNDYEVDFVWVVAVFLSSHLLYRAGVTEEHELRMASQLIQNFLKSVLHHKVAAEYEENIQAALELATRAEKELVDDKRLSVSLPGPLNRAFSHLYVDNYKGLWDNVDTYHHFAPSSNAREEKEQEGFKENKNSHIFDLKDFQPDAHTRFSTEQARSHIKRTLGSDALEAEVLDQEYLTVELISKELIYKYKNNPLCKARYLVWNPPGTSYPQQTEKTEVTILIEPELMELMVLKTHLEASFTFLSNGITIMDTVLAVLPTFYEEIEE